MKSRTLTLRKDTLTELTTDDLAQIAGASGAPCDSTTIIATLGLSCGCTGYYPSIFDPCTD